MRFLEHVDIRILQPPLMIALIVVDQVYQEFGHNLVITSMNEGKHSDTSLHYAGAAFDCRTRHVPSEKLTIMKNAILARLPDLTFDVVIEKTHIHVEYQPKYRA